MNTPPKKPVTFGYEHGAPCPDMVRWRQNAQVHLERLVAEEAQARADGDSARYTGVQAEERFLTESEGDLRYVRRASAGEIFSGSEREKLESIEPGAQVNVKPDWDAEESEPEGILNKPDFPALREAVRELETQVAGNTEDIGALQTAVDGYGDVMAQVGSTLDIRLGALDESVAERLRALDESVGGRLDGVDETLVGVIGRLDSLDSWRGDMGEGNFSTLHDQFAGLEWSVAERIGAMEGDVAERLGGMGDRLNDAESQIGGVGGQVMGLEAQVSGLDSRLGALDDSVAERFAGLGARIDRIPAQVQSDWEESRSDNVAFIKGKPVGVVTVGPDGKIPVGLLPAMFDGGVLSYAGTENFPATGSDASFYVDTTTGDIYRWVGGQYIKFTTPVSSVNTKTGDVVLTAADIKTGATESAVSVSTQLRALGDGVSGLQDQCDSLADNLSALSARVAGISVPSGVVTVDSSGKVPASLLPEITASMLPDVRSDWNVTDSASPAYIKNRPTSQLTLTAGDSSRMVLKPGTLSIGKIGDSAGLTAGIALTGPLSGDSRGHMHFYGSYGYDFHSSIFLPHAAAYYDKEGDSAYEQLSEGGSKSLCAMLARERLRMHDRVDGAGKANAAELTSGILKFYQFDKSAPDGSAAGVTSFLSPAKLQVAGSGTYLVPSRLQVKSGTYLDDGALQVKANTYLTQNRVQVQANTYLSAEDSANGVQVKAGTYLKPGELSLGPNTASCFIKMSFASSTAATASDGSNLQPLTFSGAAGYGFGSNLFFPAYGHYTGWSAGPGAQDAVGTYGRTGLTLRKNVKITEAGQSDRYVEDLVQLAHGALTIGRTGELVRDGEPVQYYLRIRRGNPATTDSKLGTGEFTGAGGYWFGSPIHLNDTGARAFHDPSNTSLASKLAAGNLHILAGDGSGTKITPGTVAVGMAVRNATVDPTFTIDCRLSRDGLLVGAGTANATSVAAGALNLPANGSIKFGTDSFGKDSFQPVTRAKVLELLSSGISTAGGLVLNTSPSAGSVFDRPNLAFGRFMHDGTPYTPQILISDSPVHTTMEFRGSPRYKFNSRIDAISGFHVVDDSGNDQTVVDSTGLTAGAGASSATVGSSGLTVSSVTGSGASAVTSSATVSSSGLTAGAATVSSSGLAVDTGTSRTVVQSGGVMITAKSGSGAVTGSATMGSGGLTVGNASVSSSGFAISSTKLQSDKLTFGTDGSGTDIYGTLQPTALTFSTYSASGGSKTPTVKYTSSYSGGMLTDGQANVMEFKDCYGYVFDNTLHVQGTGGIRMYATPSSSPKISVHIRNATGPMTEGASLDSKTLQLPSDGYLRIGDIELDKTKLTALLALLSNPGSGSGSGSEPDPGTDTPATGISISDLTGVSVTELNTGATSGTANKEIVCNASASHPTLFYAIAPFGDSRLVVATTYNGDVQQYWYGQNLWGPLGTTPVNGDEKGVILVNSKDLLKTGGETAPFPAGEMDSYISFSRITPNFSRYVPGTVNLFDASHKIGELGTGSTKVEVAVHTNGIYTYLVFHANAWRRDGSAKWGLAYHGNLVNTFVAQAVIWKSRNYAVLDRHVQTHYAFNDFPSLDGGSNTDVFPAP